MLATIFKAKNTAKKQQSNPRNHNMHCGEHLQDPAAIPAEHCLRTIFAA